MTDTDRVFVLGLDGVPWTLIERWTNEGELPSFARLRADGAAGPFESTVPATTPVAWPSIATGASADEHGIYGFQRLSRGYRQRMYTSRDCRRPPLWELLSPAVVANVPMTYPAGEIDGTMVTGMLTPSFNDRFTHPASLSAELLERIPDYRISLQWGDYADDRDAFLPDFERLVAARRELMRFLLDRTPDWRLFFFVYTAPDRLQHLFWEESVLLDHYRELDAVLGEVLDVVEERGATLFVVSDHGFGPTDRFVYVNRVLERAGYLAERSRSGGVYGTLADLGVNRSSVLRALNAVGIDEDDIVERLPRRLVDGVAERVPGDHALYDVDFTRTKAFVHDSGAVYVNDTERFDEGIVDPGDVPRLKRELIGVFEAVTDPATGERAVEVADGDELFPTDPRAPDLVVGGTDPYQARNALYPEVFGPTGGTAAGHLSEGIFLAWGPDVQPGTSPSAARVYDLAPTALHVLGEPIPSYTDGRVLTEIFRPDSTPATAPIETRAYGTAEADEAEGEAEDFDDVEERLRGLGYLS